MARKVIAHLFSSVNGVSESPNEWQFDAFGPKRARCSAPRSPPSPTR